MKKVIFILIASAFTYGCQEGEVTSKKTDLTEKTDLSASQVKLLSISMDVPDDGWRTTQLFEYDVNGQIKSFGSPSETMLGFFYNESNQLDSIYDYEASGQSNSDSYILIQWKGQLPYKRIQYTEGKFFSTTEYQFKDDKLVKAILVVTREGISYEYVYTYEYNLSNLAKVIVNGITATEFTRFDSNVNINRVFNRGWLSLYAGPSDIDLFQSENNCIELSNHGYRHQYRYNFDQTGMPAEMEVIADGYDYSFRYRFEVEAPAL